MNREIVDELMTWTMEAILSPNIQQLQDIKKKALQADPVKIPAAFSARILRYLRRL